MSRRKKETRTHIKWTLTRSKDSTFISCWVKEQKDKSKSLTNVVLYMYERFGLVDIQAIEVRTTIYEEMAKCEGINVDQNHNMMKTFVWMIDSRTIQKEEKERVNQWVNEQSNAKESLIMAIVFVSHKFGFRDFCEHHVQASVQKDLIRSKSIR